MTHMVRGLPTWLIAVPMALLSTGFVVAQSNTLHGNPAEQQVVSEMRGRLKSALANGDVAACQREGDNLARYGKAEVGEALIAQDAASNQRRLDAIKTIYKSYYDLRTLHNKKSVKQAYRLINQLQDKLLEDARDEVLVLFIPAQAVSSKVAVEFFKAAKDVHGNNTEAGELKDSARALQELDRLVRQYDALMQQLIPEVRALEQIRTFLTGCTAAYRQAADDTQPSASVASQPPARPRNVQGDWVMTSSSDGGNCNGTVVSIDQTADGSIRGIETRVTCERGVATGRAVGAGFRWANANTLTWGFRYATRSVDRLHDGNSSLTFLSDTVARESTRDAAGNAHWGEYRRR